MAGRLWNRPDVTPVIESQWVGVMKLLGSVAQACPNCGVSLGKMHARKTKCKDCGLFLYVRTRPQDRVQVLLTEEDVQALEARWHQYEDDKPQISPRSEHALAQVRNRPGFHGGCLV